MKGKKTKNFFFFAGRNIRNTIFNSPFASEEIVKGSTLLKSKNASGHDSISNEIVKASLPSSLPFLVTLFNKILQIQRSGLGE